MGSCKRTDWGNKKNVKPLCIIGKGCCKTGWVYCFIIIISEIFNAKILTVTKLHPQCRLWWIIANMENIELHCNYVKVFVPLCNSLCNLISCTFFPSKQCSLLWQKVTAFCVLVLVEVLLTGNWYTVFGFMIPD